MDQTIFKKEYPETSYNFMKPMSVVGHVNSLIKNKVNNYLTRHFL